MPGGTAPGAHLDATALGQPVFDALGQQIGPLAALYADARTGGVMFGGVHMLRRGRRRLVFVSLSEATVGPSSVTVRCGKELVRRAPSVRPGERLPVDEEQALFVHYELPVPPRSGDGRRLVACGGDGAAS